MGKTFTLTEEEARTQLKSLGNSANTNKKPRTFTLTEEEVRTQVKPLEKKQSLYVSINFDTLESDLNSLSKTIDKVYSGWQTKETMKNTLTSLQSMYNRLGKYQEYQKQYGGTDLSELHKSYKSLIDNWEAISDKYGDYKDKKSYDKAMKDIAKLENYDSKEGKNKISTLEGYLKTAGGFVSEINTLKSQQETAETRSYGGVKGLNQDKIDAKTKEYKNFLKTIGYSSYEELEKDLGNEKVLNKNAVRYQEKIKLGSVGDSNSVYYDPDYDKYVEKGKKINPEDVGTSEVIHRVRNRNHKKTTVKSDDRRAAEALSSFLKGEKPQDDGYYDKDAIFSLMTEKEFNDVAYYLAKDQEDGGNRTSKYVEFIKEILNNRRGKEIADMVDGTWRQGTFAITSGLDQFATGWTNNFSDKDYIATNHIQYASGEIREDIYEDNGWLARTGYDLLNTGANMLPSILMSTATNALLPGSGAVIGASAMGMSASGNAYQEMLNLGYDKGQARAYSVLVGVSEGGLQYALGGIGKLGGVSGKVAKAVQGIDNGIAKFAIRWGSSALAEGFEEAAQEVLNPLFMNIAAGYDTGEEIDWSEVAYSGLLGVLSGGLMEGPGLAVNTYTEYSNNKNIGQAIRDNGKVEAVFDSAMNFPKTSLVHKTYTNLTNKGINATNITDAQLGRLYSLIKNDAVDTLKTNTSDGEQQMSAVSRLVGLSPSMKFPLENSDLVKEKTKVPFDTIIGSVKSITNKISNDYKTATNGTLELDYGDLYVANIKAVINKDRVSPFPDFARDYADIVAKAIAQNTDTALYRELSGYSDDIGQFIYDTAKNKNAEQISPRVDAVVSRYYKAVTDAYDYIKGTMHSRIYGNKSEVVNQTRRDGGKIVEQSNGILTSKTGDSTINLYDAVVPEISVAIQDTLKPNALASFAGFIEKQVGSADLKKFVPKMIQNYISIGNLGEISKYFADGGARVIDAIENIGGKEYGSKRIIEGRTVRDTSNVEWTNGERAAQNSQGISRETGNAQSTISEGTIRKQIDFVEYNEVQRENYTDDMKALERENKSNYGVETVFFAGRAINKEGMRANGFYVNGTLYLQIDDVQTARSIRDHEITHHFGKSKAYDTFRRAVKSKMPVQQFAKWKEEIRLAYGELLNKLLANEFEKSGGTLTDAELRNIMDSYLEEEMLANLNAETVDFAHEYTEEISAFRREIEIEGNILSAEVSTESKAANKVSEYSKEIDAGEIRYNLSDNENRVFSVMDDLKNKQGVLFNDGRTIKIPNSDMEVLRRTYKAEEHYSNRTDGILDCIACSGNKDTKHYLYVFYKGEDGRVAPIFRLDYKFLNSYIEEVRKISEEMGYYKNEFINGNEGVRSRFTKFRGVGRNGSSNADATSGGRAKESIGTPLSDIRRGSSSKLGNKSQTDKRDSSSIPNGKHERNRDRNADGNIKYSLHSDGTFPQGSQASEIAIRWAHNEDVDTQKIVFYNDNAYLIEKFDSMDMGYLVVEKLKKKDLERYRRRKDIIVEEEHDGKDRGLQPGRKGSISNNGHNRRLSEGGRRNIDADNGIDKHNRETGKVQGVDRIQNSGRSFTGEGSRNIVRSIENRKDEIDKDVASENIRDNIRFSFAGPKSLTANLKAYRRAMEMDKAGVDIEDIWKETKWTKGRDGKFKYEISDKKYRFKKNGFVENPRFVKDYVVHTDLFEAYPMLKEVPIIFDENMDSDTEAIYRYSWDEYGAIILNPKFSEKELKKALIHELQHTIQRIEGFASGASVDYWQHKIDNGYELNDDEKSLVWGDNIAEQLYDYTAGEVEARDVEDRMGFTDKEREETFPYSLDDSEPVAFAETSDFFELQSNFKNNEQHNVMWTLKKGMLNKKEIATFYSKISELKNNKYHNYVMSNDGEYIFAIENKMVFTDGDYYYPEISTVITFNTDNETEADTMRRLFYELQKQGNEIEDAVSIVESVYGQEAISQANFEDSRTNESYTRGKQRNHGREIDSRSREDVKLSISTETQDRISKIARTEVFHDELIDLARKNKEEYVARVRNEKNLQKRLENATRQMKLTKVPIADRGKVEKLTRQIIKDMHGTTDFKTIYPQILSIYDEYIASVQSAGRVNGKLQEASDNMVRRLTDVAADIVDSAVEISVDEDYTRLKTWLKNTDISVPTEAKTEADYATFRKKHFGTISLTNDGLPIDIAYKELCETFPYLFDNTLSHPADQLNKIADVLESLKPEAYNPHADYIDDAVEHVIGMFVSEADGVARTKDTRADKLVKKVESDKWEALEKQKNAFDRKYNNYKEKIEEKINKLKEEIRGYKYTQYWEQRLSNEDRIQAVRNLRERQKISASKAHIRKMVSELKQGLDKTEKNGGIPKELVKAIAEVCSVVDFHTGRMGPNGNPTKTSLKLDALQVQYDNLKNNPDYDIESEWNEEISNYIRLLNSTVRGKSVSDLTSQELSALEDILVSIKHTIANAKKQIGVENALENREIGIAIYEDLNKRDDFIASSKKMLVKRMGTNFFAASSLNPMRVAEMIAGYDRDAEFYKLFSQLNDGVHKGDMFRMDATKPFNVLMEGPGNQALMYDFLTNLYDTGIKDTDGNMVLLPKNMICEVVMLWERKQGRQHLENGGMTVPNLKLFNKGKVQEAYTEGARRTRPLTETDINRLRNMLDSYDKAWINEARTLFNEKSQKAINETSLKLLGRSIANAKNYIPIHTDRNFVRTDIEGLKVDATLEGSGSLKAVVQDAKQPIRITGLSYSTNEHIDFISKYYGLAIPIRNFNKVYNISFKETDGSIQSVKESIGRKWGVKIQKGVIDQTLKDLQTSRTKADDWLSKGIATIQSNWVGATLSSNPSVSIKQLTSYVTASSVLGTSPLVKALPYFTHTTKTISEIDRHTGIHFKRRLGYSTQELGDRANRKTGQRLANKARKVLSQSQITAWVNHLPPGLFPSNWMQSVDCRVAAVLWEASKYYVADTMKISKDNETYWKEVTKIYERTIEETQSNYDILHKPEVLKSTSEMTRLLSMFQNDALQGSGLLWNSFNDWNTKYHNYKSNKSEVNEKALKKAQERFKNAAIAQVSSALTLAMLTLLARALIRKIKPYKDDEENKVTSESIAKQVGMDTLGNLFTNAIPVIGNLLISAKDSFLYGYELTSVPAFDTVQEFIDSVSGFVNMIDKYFAFGSQYSNKEKTDAVIDKSKELALSLTTFFGIPVRNYMNMLNGVKGYIKDIKEGDFFHDIDDIIATQKRVYSYADLAAAISSGDRKQEEKILTYFKNIGVDIQKGALTTQLKPVYIAYYVDEPKKAYELRKKLVLNYEYKDEVFNDWIYAAYVNAVMSDGEYAEEIASAAKRVNEPLEEDVIFKKVASAYKKLYKEDVETSKIIRKELKTKLKISNVDFDNWEREIDEKTTKETEARKEDKKKYK